MRRMTRPSVMKETTRITPCEGRALRRNRADADGPLDPVGLIFFYGVTVKFVTPGPPGALNYGPQPVSDVGEQPACDMHARVMPL